MKEHQLYLTADLEGSEIALVCTCGWSLDLGTNPLVEAVCEAAQQHHVAVKPQTPERIVE